MEQQRQPGRQVAPTRQPAGEVAPWVRRLFAGRGLHPDERRLFWYGQHLGRFLRWCRTRGDRAGLDDLRAGYLRELETTLPAVPDWQMAQVRQALEAFAQGVDHWRWEAAQHLNPPQISNIGNWAEGISGFPRNPLCSQSAERLLVPHPPQISNIGNWAEGGAP
ncbi:MAG: hypothetical protein HS113_23875 [Verrucomicrobiales bacterium]|nr:hypothetical protein [Verrucomicrobiales bacterium]